MAVQHMVLKTLRKKTGLCQRDWEVLCACQRLSLTYYPFTAAKIDDYLQGAYFLPSLYNNLNTLVTKGYLRVVVPGKPFRSESYEFSNEGNALVKRAIEEIRRFAEAMDETLAGKVANRVW
jgi:hypothetical protein